jgi:hypothetical protein
MSEGRNCNSRPEIQVLFALFVPDPGTAPANQRNVVAAVTGNNEFLKEFAGV